MGDLYCDMQLSWLAYNGTHNASIKTNLYHTNSTMEKWLIVFRRSQQNQNCSKNHIRADIIQTKSLLNQLITFENWWDSSCIYIPKKNHSKLHGIIFYSPWNILFLHAGKNMAIICLLVHCILFCFYFIWLAFHISINQGLFKYLYIPFSFPSLDMV